jgi:hypothetical protein
MAATTSRPATNTIGSNRVVVFADILGFAALTEANEIDIQVLKAYSRPFVPGSMDTILGKPINPLAQTFSHFHQSVEGAIVLSNMKFAMTAITFSDSAFFATNYLFEAASLAIHLEQSFLSSGVPVRMGIGFGSFAALKFRSDVSLDGGDHASQFLGSAVVRAHHAEKCGIKGMRILLHPSVESLLTDSTHCPQSSPFEILECSKEERTNTTHVRYELDYWRLAPSKEFDAWHKFQDMWDVAPESEEVHYHATAEAINRMRIAHGKASLANLRRRTLPR